MGNLVFDSRALSFCAGRVPVLGRVLETGRKERESQPKSKWQSLKSKCFGVWRLCVGTLALALTGRVSLDVPATSPRESWVFSGETEPLLWGHVTVETYFTDAKLARWKARLLSEALCKRSVRSPLASPRYSVLAVCCSDLGYKFITSSKGIYRL